MTDLFDHVESVQRLSVNPEDIIILTVKDDLDEQEVVHLSGQWKAATNLTNTVIVLTQGMKLSVVEPAPA